MKKIIFSLISLLFSVSLLIISIFGWFTFKASKDNLIITTGNMEVSVILYKGQDFDKDGLLDVDENGNEIFNQVDTTQDNLIEGLSPNDYVTLKLQVDNIGDYDGLTTIICGSFQGQLQNVLYVDNGQGLTAESQILTGEDKTIFSDNLVLKQGSQDFIIKIKFATLSELQSLPDSPFLLNDNLNSYKSVSGSIKAFTMVITVQTVQNVD